MRLPLEHTAVQIEINGFVARVTLAQCYGNPFEEAIEAVYAFPLPNKAAVDGMRGAGATEMRHAIIDVLARLADPGRLRIALLLTDGYVGNEAGIVEAIERERRGARVFALGVGSAPNRFLLDRTALVGRGDVFSVRPDEDAGPVVEHFFHRVDRPTLTDIAGAYRRSGRGGRSGRSGRSDNVRAIRPLATAGANLAAASVPPQGPDRQWRPALSGRGHTAQGGPVSDLQMADRGPSQAPAYRRARWSIN